LPDNNELYCAAAGAPAAAIHLPMSSQNDQPVLSKEEMRQWETYADNSITFRYPGKLVLIKRNGRILLTHSIRFNHGNPCDYAGNAPSLRRLIDFKVSIKIVKGNGYSEAPGGDEEISVGMLKGESMRSHYEGCGEYMYRFPIGENKTLIVKREIISLFDPTADQLGDDKRALKQPGIIKPDMEKRFFYSILSSIKILKADQLKSK